MRSTALGHLLATCVACAVIGLVSCTGNEARAQSHTGFAVNRFEPAERGSNFFVVDDLALRSPGALGATLDYAYKPLVIYDGSGAERFALVRHQTMLHLGGAIVVAERLRLAIDVPLAIYQDGEAATVNGAELRAASAPAFGDVRLAADVRILGEPGGPFVLAGGVRFWLPTGLRSQFTSDGSARIAPQLLASGSIGAFVWAGRAALVYRSRSDDYAGRDLGSELTLGLGAGIRTWHERLVVGPELNAATSLATGATAFGKRETPIEALLGAHAGVTTNLWLGAGIGTGIGHGDGTPQVRGLLSLEWRASLPPERRGPERDEERDVWEGVGERPQPVPPQKPLAVITESEIHIEEELRFATDSADLAPESDKVLAAVKRILDEHPDVRLVRIEGHTDASGDATYNDDLSTRRAAAVQSWLTTHGIAPARLESVGRGSRDPVDTNDTEEGRAKNRRVVFRIIDRAN